MLPQRPPLSSLQPPVATIYLTRTHLAARKLSRSLLCIRLQRGLARRPKASTLVSQNILPSECCSLRRSGEVIWGAGVAGALVERKRKLEREQMKASLRVRLERKAKEIRARKKDGGVGILVWRWSRKMRVVDREDYSGWGEGPKKDKVSGLRRFYEGLTVA